MRAGFDQFAVEKSGTDSTIGGVGEAVPSAEFGNSTVRVGRGAGESGRHEEIVRILSRTVNCVSVGVVWVCVWNG